MQLLNRSTVYSAVDALLLLSRIIMHFVLISFPVNGPGDAHTARRADRREALIHFSPHTLSWLEHISLASTYLDQVIVAKTSNSLQWIHQGQSLLSLRPSSD